MSVCRRREREIHKIFQDMSLPVFHSILSITYLLLMGVRIKGWGKINAFSFVDGKIKSRIESGNNSIIGRRVTIKAPLKMEENVLISDGCSITGSSVKIGRGTNIMHNCEIVGPVQIGRYCAVARNSLFQGRNHSMKQVAVQAGLYSRLLNDRFKYVYKDGITIGNDVWVASRAILVPGVNIGDGAVIGAGSVVTKDVEPYSLVAGAPAIHKKYRFSDHIRKQLLEIKWWNWTEEKIQRNKQFFVTDLTKVNDLYRLVKE